MGTKIVLTIVLLAVVVVVPSVSAQVVYGQPASGGVRFIYNSWSTETDGEDTTLSQFMTPVSGFIPVRENFDLSFYIANSSNSLSAPDGDADLNGLSDLRVQARHSFANDRFLAALGLNLPTGKKELDGDEWAVLQGLSRTYTSFPMRRFGEGFGFNMLLGGATEVNEGFNVGAGVSYQYIGKYEPYAEYVDYNPGDIVGINARAEVERDEWQISTDLVYSIYTTDKINDEEIFKQSPQFDIRFGVRRETETNLGYGGFIRYVARGENAFYDSSGTELASVKLFGNEFMIGGHVAWDFAEGWQALPSADLRLIGGSELEVAGNQMDVVEFGFDGATIFGVGASVGRNLTETIGVQGGLKLYTGTASNIDFFTQESVDSDVTGYSLSVGVSASM